MKSFNEKVADFFAFLKVSALCIAALYLVFWFWRFFELPFTDFLIPIFDFGIGFTKLLINTVQIYEGHVAEMGYFIMAVALVIITFVFSMCEDFANEIDRRAAVRSIARKRLLQAKVNEELAKENRKNINSYKYFSVFIKFKADFINELVASKSTITKEKALEIAYMTTVNAIKKKIPYVSAEKKGKSIFVKAGDFENFDFTMNAILNSIKTAKAECSKECFNLEFMVIIDAQMNKTDCEKSFALLNRISDTGDYNKAIVTTAFKLRFEAVKYVSKFTIDTINFSISLNPSIKDETELFILKTKSKAI